MILPIESRSATTPSGSHPGGEAPLEACRLKLAKEVLERFGRVRVRMQGTSMLPAIWPGDTVDIVRTEITSLRHGDVVFFESGDRFFCHRIRAIELTPAGRRIRTRGDHLTHDDAAVPATAVLGKLTPEVHPRPYAAAALRLVSLLSQRPISWLLKARSPH